MASRVLFEDSVYEPGLEQAANEKAIKSRKGQGEGGVKKIAAAETRYLTISKGIVIGSILLAAGLVSTGTYIFLEREEDDDYINSYHHFTDTARDTIELHMQNVFLAARSMSSTLTAQAKGLNMEFPFVTFPSFEALGNAARAQGGFEAVFFEPVVNDTNLQLWNQYSQEHQGWIQGSREAAVSFSEGDLSATDYIDEPIRELYFGIPDRGIPVENAPSYGPGPYLPVWMQSPPPFSPVIINFDAYVPNRITMNAAFESREAVMSEVQDTSSVAGNALKPGDHSEYHKFVVSNDPNMSAFDRPHTVLHVPVFHKLNDKTSPIVGFIGMIISWDRYTQYLLPEGITGLVCVLKNSCGQAHTYILDGNTANFVGSGDLHDSKYDETEVVLPFHRFLDNETQSTTGHCLYSYHLYSSSDFEDRHRSNIAIALTITVACTFFFMIGAFFFYDYFVKRRNSKVLDIANKTSAIVSSLFPSNVRERLLHGEKSESRKEIDGAPAGTRSKLKNFLMSEAEMESMHSESNDLDPYGSKPIADIFPETTVVFADIVGFTAWSSTREPTQVFTLLETIYKAFDDIATRRRVFKVETVGDCYVAVCGLPDPRGDHAVAMCRFARACMRKFLDLVHKLELSLGPDTAELSMRMGLHSGPVTAGVLRGERARFQLFGDTMNTASRMESMGEKGMIQVSQETNDLLVKAGKGNWARPREDKIVAKGKGLLQTYWLATEYEQVVSTSLSTGTGTAVKAHTPSKPVQMNKSERLVRWNCDLMMKSLLEIECARRVETNSSMHMQTHPSLSSLDAASRHGQGTVLEEVKEIIRLPNFTAKQQAKPTNVELAPKVAQQLQSYIEAVAMLYRENPFHCFEHASHVTMSVSKLMSRIIAPELSSEDVAKGNFESTLHDHTYGITSDPLVQFACVFSALIHDVDHTGVPNTQLAKENPKMAELYRGRSIAEQNSVDLAWSLLMEPDYRDLRNAIYRNPSEEARFRQLVVNSVMATDIMDKDLKQLRNHRWERAFSESSRDVEESPKDAVDRKATIVIEHLIQASDVAHTMQHWHVYRKWNQKLYTEMYSAFISGRADKDPADFWYQGELGFFDFYIIPLARKLKDCGVFGVSSDEYYNYATKNRAEWEQRGRDVVAEMVEEMKTTVFETIMTTMDSSESQSDSQPQDSEIQPVSLLAKKGASAEETQLPMRMSPEQALL